MAILPTKRTPRRCRPIDLLTAAFFVIVLISVFVFTPFSSQKTVPRFDPRLRNRLLALAEAGKDRAVEKCGAGMVDYMPCEDPRRNSGLSREMNFYRERQCPKVEETEICLVPNPIGYRVSVQWPQSLNKIWHSNMPHNKIADRKGHQGWMKKEGPYFIFPGGGTMFPDGAIQYIEKLKQYVPIDSGVLRTALDMGCGVASFGGYLLNENILTLSFAPRDSHKSQIQFALERGVPAFVAMLGTRRLPFPAFSFDLLHCSRTCPNDPNLAPEQLGENGYGRSTAGMGVQNYTYKVTTLADNPYSELLWLVGSDNLIFDGYTFQYTDFGYAY